MGKQLSDWVEKVVGKGEIARYKQFLVFQRCFQKISVADVSKRVSMEYRVKYYDRFWGIFSSVQGD